LLQQAAFGAVLFNLTPRFFQPGNLVRIIVLSGKGELRLNLLLFRCTTG